MSEPPSEQERFPWAGPALFITVAVLQAWFFWWFVQA
jgi:hypothetical protein